MPRLFFLTARLFPGEENQAKTLTTKSVEGPSLPLKRINNVHSRNGLPPSVLRVSNGVTDDILQEDLENTASLLVDQTADTLHATPASQTTNRWLRNSLNVVAEHLTMSFCSSFSQSLSSLSTPRHLAAA
ncbi:hypothetical protein JHK82_041359 [Glycine max]|nr:hypothetical protein JHK86_041418 [Glycine max]KAG5104389.1 hypothetical protein JHK82_041359 [Glycine max]KAG5115513.1 hypothetical protein JHK84_041626 [Glycine max]